MAAPNYHRLLLPKVPIFEKEGGSSGRSFSATGKLLPFLLEELVSNGALEIVVEDGWRYRSVLDELPDILKPYVRLSRATNKHYLLAQKIIEPIFDEFGLETKGVSVGHKGERGIDDPAVNAAIGIYFGLPDFLFALDHKLQLHFDVERFQEWLKVVMNHSMSHESRANAAVLLGIFSSYEVVSHDALILQSGAPKELAKRFVQLTDDLYFKELSSEMHDLGFIGRLPVAMSRANRVVKKLFEKFGSDEVINFGSKAVTVATGVPVPDSALAKKLIGEQYLPPIAELSGAIKRAYEGLMASDGSENFIGPSDRLFPDDREHQ